MAYLNITTVSNKLGEIINDVKVTSFEYDWNMKNNYADDLIDVWPVADVSIEKFVDNNYPKFGDVVRWTLIASNNGPNVAHNVVVRDVLPRGLKFISSNGDYSNNNWRISSLNVGETISLEIVCKVTSTGNFNNVADIWADELDLDKSNNHADESIHVAPASDLSITKMASKYHYRVGDVIEYVIEVVNNGPDTARNIKISEILDDLLKLKSFKATKGKFNKYSNIWTIKSLGYGESAKLIIRVVATGTGIIKNTVKVTSDTFDYDKSNNKDYVIVNVTEEPSNEVDTPDNSNYELQSVLEMHPTANPILMLMFAIFSLAFLGNDISKKN